jgi:1,4-dihydroxy-6-naphthoate synthase
MAALAAGKVQSSLKFRHELADVETLNQWALEKRLDVTKLSFAALGLVRDSYGLLYSGGALGRGCGPLVVARSGAAPADLAKARVAGPGAMTTAALLLGLYLGRRPDMVQMVFSEVMPAVAEGKAHFGLVIHEARFTYEQYGLEAVLDLGQWWEQETGMAIPLGGIAIRRDLAADKAAAVDRAIRDSMERADTESAETMAYVTRHAQETDPDVMVQHIRLYVNSFSLDLGPEGRAAVEMLFSRAERAGLLPPSSLTILAY